MADIILTPGTVNNRQDPIKLGVIEDFRNPSISKLTLAQNVDLDNNGMATRRIGRTLRLAGSPHSFWVSPLDRYLAYFVEDSVLKKLNIDYTAAAVTTLNSNRPLSCEVLNGEIVVSNGSDIGWLSGTSYTAFAPVLTQFELAMPAGQYLAFDHGDATLLCASGSVIYRSKPHYADVRESRLSEFPMDGYVRMLGTVEDGWWVATEKHVSFVQRDGDEGFTFVHISNNVPPDGCFTAGWEETEGGQRRYVCWATVDGFCVGRAGGRYENISPDVALPTGDSGRLFSRTHNGIRQYIAVINGPEGAENFTAPTLTVHSITV